MVNEKYCEASKISTPNSESVKMPLAINFLYRLVKKTMDESDTLTVHVEADVFGNEFKTYLLRDDIIAFCTMSEIATNFITLYMRHLHSMLKGMNLDYMYGFVEPGRISFGSGKSEERSRTLANRLNTARIGQIFLAPYNVGSHWMLLGIEPYSEAVYFFDPFQQAIPSDMKQVVNIALKMFNAQNGRKSRVNQWKEMKCPLQPGSVECGYYVMKYMKDIIEDEELAMTTKKLKEKDTYTQEEIDEMRVQWVEILEANMSI